MASICSMVPMLLPYCCLCRRAICSSYVSGVTQGRKGKGQVGGG